MAGSSDGRVQVTRKSGTDSSRACGSASQAWVASCWQGGQWRLRQEGTKQIEARPGALERDLETELERSTSDRCGGAGAAALRVERKKELAKLLRTHQVGRFAGEHRQRLNGAQVGVLRGECQAAQVQCARSSVGVRES
jgi:hypothetical protein